MYSIGIPFLLFLSLLPGKNYLATMYFKASFIAAFLAALAVAAPSPKGHVLHEKRDTPLKKWVKRSSVKDTTLLPMRIGMVQSNLHRADELMMEVYVSDLFG